MSEQIIRGKQYGEDRARSELSEASVAPDPFQQFAVWFQDALSAGVAEANAMTLATATSDGRPSARMVLLKGYDPRGFVFYSNYDSRKGRELAENPWAALVFFWPELERQVRITGAASRVPREESEAYYRSRPLGSRIGAWASRQSEVIDGREGLERRVRELAAEFEGREPPLPPNWGGYRLSPDSVEFWQGRPSRLHDRLRYRRAEGGAWVLERLSP